MVVDSMRAAGRWVRGGNADRCFPGKSRKTGEIGNLNLWFPNFVDQTGGSKWVQAQPAGSNRVQAQPAGTADRRSVTN